MDRVSRPTSPCEVDYFDRVPGEGPVAVCRRVLSKEGIADPVAKILQEMLDLVEEGKDEGLAFANSLFSYCVRLSPSC